VAKKNDMMGLGLIAAAAGAALLLAGSRKETPSETPPPGTPGDPGEPKVSDIHRVGLSARPSGWRWAVATGTPLAIPIRVFHGETVSLRVAQFHYSGPGGRLYVCWGLKKRDLGAIHTGVDFNNGQGLEPAGKFAYAAVDVPASAVTTLVPFSGLAANMQIGTEVPATSGYDHRVYNVFIWVTIEPTATEARFATSNTDAGVLEVLPATYEMRPDIEGAFAVG